MDRHLRTKILLGEDKMRKLQRSKVTVVGLGAVGSYVVEALARAGVGNLRLADFDLVDCTNINRQLYALESTLGLPKTMVAKNRVLDINPQIKVELFREFIDKNSCLNLFENNPDIVVDAIDSLTPKVQVLVELHNRSIPVISSMGAARKTDPSKIKVGDISKTRNCPLARFVRKRLRRQGVTSGIKCVYSTEITEDEVVEPSENDSINERGRKRMILGSLPTITGIFGLTIANKVIEEICGGFTKEK